MVLIITYTEIHWNDAIQLFVIFYDYQGCFHPYVQPTILMCKYGPHPISYMGFMYLESITYISHTKLDTKG